MFKFDVVHDHVLSRIWCWSRIFSQVYFLDDVDVHGYRCDKRRKQTPSHGGKMSEGINVNGVEYIRKDSVVNREIGDVRIIVADGGVGLRGKLRRS